MHVDSCTVPCHTHTRSCPEETESIRRWGGPGWCPNCGKTLITNCEHDCKQTVYKCNNLPLNSTKRGCNNQPDNRWELSCGGSPINRYSTSCGWNENEIMEAHIVFTQ